MYKKPLVEIGLNQRVVFQKRFIHFTNSVNKNKGGSRIILKKENHERVTTSQAISAFQARLGIDLDPTVLETALTHKSYYSNNDTSEVNDTSIENNEKLAGLGKQILSLYTMEYLDAKFPNLPPNVLVGLQQYHFVGLGPLSSFAKVVGLEYLVKWKPVGGQPGSPPIAGVGEIGGGGLTKVLVNAVQALIGAIHSSSIIKSKSKANDSNNNNNNNQNGNGDAAKEFIHKYLIPQYRLYDNQFYLHNNTTNDNLTAGSSAIIANLMNCTAYSSTNPKRVLKALLDRKGLPSKLHYRILKESGRLSANPVFIVGVFINNNNNNNNNNNSSTQLIKIGEGFGSSIKMAEFRATRHALLSYYAKELNTFDLPSNPNYRPNRLGDTIAIP